MANLSEMLGEQPQPQAQADDGGNEKVMDIVKDLVNSVNDQQTYDAFLQILETAGLDISQLPEEYSPEIMEQARAELLGGQMPGSEGEEMVAPEGEASYA